MVLQRQLRPLRHVQHRRRVNLPLTGGMGARISLLTQHRDDWVTNRAPTQPTDARGLRRHRLRAAVAVQAASDFSALFNLHGAT
jgi:iron complex outermembrane receptor protein